MHKLLTRCLALILGMAIGGWAWAQSPLVIKVGWPTSDAESDPMAVTARAFKEAVERRSNGTIQVQLYPNRQLGDDKQLVEGVRFGTVDGAVVTNAVLAQAEAAFSVLELPFVFESEAHAWKVLDGPVGADLVRRAAAKGIVVLGFTEGGFRSMLNNKRPITQPQDMSGIKLRVMQNPVYIDMVNALGGAPVPMAWGETITAIQQGTIDGLELPISLVQPLKVNEFTRHLSLTQHTFTVYELMVSKRLYDRLSAEQQALLVEAGREAAHKQRAYMAGQTPAALAALERAGMTINRVSDVAVFRKAVEPVYDKARKSGQRELLDAILFTSAR